MTQEYSGSDDDSKSEVLMMHPDRVGADPTEGWRRGSRGTLRKSCDTCTSSKTKCQGSIPCDRCKKRRIECKFSKRRRCGPKARTEDEKRPRTSMGTSSHPGRLSAYSPERSGAQHHPGTPLPPSPPLPPIGTIGLDGGGSGGGGGGGGGTLPRSSSKFGGPLTSDGLSLVELIAPTFSDTGGSGSSAGIGASIDSSCHAVGDSAYSQTVGAPGNRYTPIHTMDPSGVSPFLGPAANPPHHRNRGGANTGSRPGPPSSSVVAAPSRSSMPAAVDLGARQDPVRSPRATLTSSHSAPIGTLGAAALPCPPQDLPARAKSVEEATGVIGSLEETRGAGQTSFFPESRAVADSMGGNSGYMRVDRGEERFHGAAVASAAPSPSQPPPRGPLPMSLDSRTKMHLRTFMRTVGSLVLVPGTDAIRSAIFSDGNDSEEVPDAAATPAAPAASAAADAGGGGGGEDVTEASGQQARRSAGRDTGSDDGIVDALAEACRAEAWAAAAVGALFSGAPEEEGKDYVSRALRALSGCLDAPFPEVAAVMILLTLFWMHSMDTRKVARYFGFAQQVGLELGQLMPEGLRHTIAFVSTLVTMTLNLDPVPSFSLKVKPHEAWGVSLRNSSNRPSVDPFILALTATTVVCNEMLNDGAGRASRAAIGVNGFSPPPPSQILTDLLATAAKALGKAEVQDGNQNPEHMLALLHGLKGYTHASRGELGDAEASARLMLEIIDRHAAVLHLPLTFTLAEASRRLLRATAEQSSRPALPGVHVDALRVARSTLSFARPRQPAKAAGGGGGAGPAAGGGGGGGGGWCTFGSEILAAFDKAAGVDGGGGLPEKINDDRDRSRAMPSRSGSMSPPPRRSAKPLPRAVILSQQWKPTTGGGEVTSSAGGGSRHAPRTNLESASPLALSRWDASLSGAPAAAPAASPSSVLLGTGADAPSDWVDRVRKMPTVGPTRPSSPNVVHRMAIGEAGAAPTPPPEGNGPSAASLALLGPGPMPTGPPAAAVKYASEPPDNLALLSTVASPDGYSVPQRRSSFDDRSGLERQQPQQPAVRQRRSGHAGGGGNGNGNGNGNGGSGSGGGAAERDGDDLPPPGNPGLTAGMSFDPNRDDGTLPFTLGSS